MYAVTIRPMNSILFMAEDPGEGPWEVTPEVNLDLPFNYDVWPEGTPAPEQVVAVSTSDPRHFKVFKYARDIDPGEFRPTGNRFGGLYSPRSWARLRDRLPTHFRFLENLGDESPLAGDTAAGEPGKAR